jgi:hypothetical protein
MTVEVQSKQCEKCHALIRFDTIEPEAKEYIRPKESKLILAGVQTGLIRRGVFNHAVTWEYECVGCLNGTSLDGHDTPHGPYSRYGTPDGPTGAFHHTSVDDGLETRGTHDR